MTDDAGGDGRLVGALTSWDDARGFGFITPSTQTRRVFVHISAFPRGAERPRAGDEVTYRVATSRSGKPEAVAVRHLGAPASVIRDEKRDHLYRQNRGAQNLVSYVVIVAFVVLYLVVEVYWDVPTWVALLYLVTSAFSFVVYAIDKQAAVSGRWRTSESTLLAIGLLGGWPGAIVAQQTLRHKTRKRSFQIPFYGCVALNVIAFVTFTSPPVAALLR